MLVVFNMFHKQCSISKPICFAQYKLPLPYMARPVYRYSPATQYLKVRLASFIGIGLNDLNGFGHRRALDNSLHLIYLLLSKVGTFYQAKYYQDSLKIKPGLYTLPTLTDLIRYVGHFNTTNCQKKFLDKSGVLNNFIRSVIVNHSLQPFLTVSSQFHFNCYWIKSSDFKF